MVTSDEKSGYDHVKLQKQSQTYFGVQFGGWILKYTSLPFGFKASPYIYIRQLVCKLRHTCEVWVSALYNTLMIEWQQRVYQATHISSGPKIKFLSLGMLFHTVWLKYRLDRAIRYHSENVICNRQHAFVF